jgi:hypothetical protein
VRGICPSGHSEEGGRTGAVKTNVGHEFFSLSLPLYEKKKRKKLLDFSSSYSDTFFLPATPTPREEEDSLPSFHDCNT